VGGLPCATHKETTFSLRASTKGDGRSDGFKTSLSSTGIWMGLGVGLFFAQSTRRTPRVIGKRGKQRQSNYVRILGVLGVLGVLCVKNKITIWLSTKPWRRGAADQRASGGHVPDVNIDKGVFHALLITDRHRQVVVAQSLGISARLVF
jgi:hypothetical protein